MNDRDWIACDFFSAASSRSDRRGRADASGTRASGTLASGTRASGTRASGTLAAVAAVTLVACGQRALEPYDGQAFPDRRPRVAWPDAGPAAVTSDNGSDTITVVSLTDHRALGGYPIGLDPLANDGAHHLTLDPVRPGPFAAERLARLPNSPCPA